MNRKKALKILMIWCAFHLFALVMSYSEIEIFNDGGNPETEEFWPFVEFVRSSTSQLWWDYNHPKYGQIVTERYFEGIFLNYDWTEFAVYVGGAIFIYFFYFYFCEKNK